MQQDLISVCSLKVADIKFKVVIATLLLNERLVHLALWFVLKKQTSKVKIWSFIWLGSNRSFTDETITVPQIWRQFPAQALSNPFGYGLLSPLITALNHVGYSQSERVWLLFVFFPGADT